MSKFFEALKVNLDNIPLQRPGVYRIRELASGKTYIGISRNLLIRARQHAYAKGSGKLANAIRKHGAEAFLFEPIFYCLTHVSDISFLPQMEAELIIEYDSVNAGYNIIEACGRVGPYGAEFAKLIAESHAKRTPEERSAIMRKGKLAMDPARLSEIGKRNALSQGAEILATRLMTMRAGQSPEKRIEIGRLGGLASSLAVSIEQKRAKQAKGVATYMQNTTPEQRSQRFKEGPLGLLTIDQLSRNGTKGVVIANSRRTAEERSALGRKASAAAHQSRTPQERNALALKAGILGGAAYAAKSDEERSAVGKKVWASRVANGTTSTPTKGSRWINNGAIRKRLSADDPLPDGWAFGWHMK